MMPTTESFSQRRNTLSISAEPLISWFSDDNIAIKTKGAHLGVKYGLTFDHFFDRNYAFTSGIYLTRLGGYLSFGDTVAIEGDYDSFLVPTGNSIHYAVQYINVPLGLKLKTTKIGYKTFFIDMGMNALFRLSSKISTDNPNISKLPANKEINLFNLAYYAGGGLEYSLGGNTSLLGGLYYTNTLLDLSTDLSGKPAGKTFARILSIKLGIIF